MNNGTRGAISKPDLQDDGNFEIQSETLVTATRTCAGLREVRPRSAEFIGADVDEIGSPGDPPRMNFIADGLELKEGDEIIMSSMEHPVDQSWGLKAKRYGVKDQGVLSNLPTRDVDEAGPRLQSNR